MNELQALLTELHMRGITLLAQGEALRFRPQRLVNPLLLEEMKANKLDLLAFAEEFEERAAIMEFDVGLSRNIAEQLAWEDCFTKCTVSTKVRICPEKKPAPSETAS